MSSQSQWDKLVLLGLLSGAQPYDVDLRVRHPYRVRFWVEYPPIPDWDFRMEVFHMLGDLPALAVKRNDQRIAMTYLAVLKACQVSTSWRRIVYEYYGLEDFNYAR